MTEEVGTMTNKDVDFVAPHTLDPQRHVGGPRGVYLDEEKRKASEVARAKAEGREPELDDPPADAGTPLYTESQLKQQGADLSHLKEAHKETLSVNESKDESKAAKDESKSETPKSEAPKPRSRR